MSDKTSNWSFRCQQRRKDKSRLMIRTPKVQPHAGSKKPSPRSQYSDGVSSSPMRLPEQGGLSRVGRWGVHITSSAMMAMRAELLVGMLALPAMARNRGCCPRFASWSCNGSDGAQRSRRSDRTPMGDTSRREEEEEIRRRRNRGGPHLRLLPVAAGRTRGTSRWAGPNMGRAMLGISTILKIKKKI